MADEMEGHKDIVDYGGMDIMPTAGHRKFNFAICSILVWIIVQTTYPEAVQI